jgi:hypothetical protein
MNGWSNALANVQSESTRMPDICILRNEENPWLQGMIAAFWCIEKKEKRHCSSRKGKKKKKKNEHFASNLENNEFPQ